MKVTIKWNKLSYDATIDPTAGVGGFKSTIQSLTGVPPDRQKLMAKGAWIGTLKDDADLTKAALKEGHQIMLMGTADVVAAPKDTVVFIEDMTAEQKAEKGVVISAGLKNMGNTCYMNSTMQCFRHMSELRQALLGVRPQSGPTQVATTMSSLARDTFVQLDSSADSVFPNRFVLALRTNFPQPFDQVGNSGHHMQQDAEEFLNVLTNSLKEGLGSVASTLAPGQDYDGLLGVAVEEQQVCQETPDEPPMRKTDRLTKLICNIEGTVGRQGSNSIDHLQDGLKLGLEGTVEKHSSILGRDAIWLRKQRVASLPKYLCIQFMRFFWKPTPDSTDHTGIKCKIMRKVSYPESLDVIDLCNDALQVQLRLNREQEDKLQEEILVAKRAKIEAECSSSAGSGSASASANATEEVGEGKSAGTGADGGASMEVEDDEDAEALRAALAMSVGAEVPPPAPASASSASAPSPFGKGVPATFNGMYELHSVVTHKGRSADSGHYIGWTRQAPNSPFWWKYDDDVVTQVKTEDIMRLDGGGDHHMAYLMFYRAKDSTLFPSAK